MLLLKKKNLSRGNDNGSEMPFSRMGASIEERERLREEGDEKGGW